MDVNYTNSPERHGLFALIDEAPIAFNQIEQKDKAWFIRLQQLTNFHEWINIHI